MSLTWGKTSKHELCRQFLSQLAAEKFRQHEKAWRQGMIFSNLAEKVSDATFAEQDRIYRKSKESPLCHTSTPAVSPKS